MKVKYIITYQQENWIDNLDISADKLPSWLESPEYRDTSLNNEHSYSSCRIVPKTKVYVIYKRYSISFVMDVSNSMATLDFTDNEVLMDKCLNT